MSELEEIEELPAVIERKVHGGKGKPVSEDTKAKRAEGRLKAALVKAGRIAVEKEAILKIAAAEEREVQEALEPTNKKKKVEEPIAKKKKKVVIVEEESSSSEEEVVIVKKPKRKTASKPEPVTEPVIQRLKRA